MIGPCAKIWFVMEMLLWGAKRLALKGWAGQILSASLSLARASIADTFENAAIALARWAIKPREAR